MQKQTYDQTYENGDQLLEAWNEWKDLCSIAACSDKNRKPLTKLVTAGFREKLATLVKYKVTPSLAVHEFDTAIIFKAVNPRKNKTTGEQRVKKAWKEFTWKKVAESKDPPLKVIHGELIGPRSVMSEIVEEYVESNFSGKSGGHAFHPDLSTDIEIEGKDGSITKFEDFLPSPNPSLSDDEKNDLRRDIEKILNENFTPQEMACLLAKGAGITLTNRNLLDFCGFESTKANEVCNSALGRLQKILVSNFQFDEDEDTNKEILAEILFLLKKAIRAEKGSGKFLLEVDRKS